MRMRRLRRLLLLSWIFAAEVDRAERLGFSFLCALRVCVVFFYTSPGGLGKHTTAALDCVGQSLGVSAQGEMIPT